MTTKTTTPTCVADIMTRDPICVTPDATVRELAAILDTDEISGAPVVDGQSRVVGVVSRTDLLHQCLNGSMRSDRSFFETLTDGFEDDELTEIDLEALGRIEDFMATDPVIAAPTDTIESVGRKMTEAGIHRVIVTDSNRRVEGIVSSLDVIKALTK